MNKRALFGILTGMMAAGCLGIGFWKFTPASFEVPVTLSSGEKALISGTIPLTAWVGEESPLKVRFNFVAPISSPTAQLRAQLALADADLSPKGEISLPFNPAKEVDFAWQVNPRTSRVLEGTLWIYCSVDGSPLQAILARRFQVKAVTLWGITAIWYRRIGFGMLMMSIFLLTAFTGRREKKAEMKT